MEHQIRPREVKDPDVRRAQLLDTAMKIFAERGYEATSMRDIARAAHVTPGLAYHYFDSKQKLFAEALDRYALLCAREGVEILDAPTLSFMEKLDALLDLTAQADNMPYHAFFHSEAGGAFHAELSERMRAVVEPHLSAALRAEARRRGADLPEADVLARFIASGFAGFVTTHDGLDVSARTHLRAYVIALVDSQLVPAAER